MASKQLKLMNDLYRPSKNGCRRAGLDLDAGRVPEVDRAIEEIGTWLRSKLGLAVLAAA